jgi:hypothetical protein
MGDGDGYGREIGGCGGPVSSFEVSGPTLSFPATSTLAISALATGIDATPG